MRAGQDFGAIPWAAVAPNPALVAWLGQQPSQAGDAALIIGCGLGDDAEEAARRGYQVTGFDVSPTAIRHCRERFPGSAVDYQSRTCSSFPPPGRERSGWWWRSARCSPYHRRSARPPPRPSRRRCGQAALFVRCLARDDDEPPVSRPWPVSRRELRDFTAAGLRETEFAEQAAVAPHGRFFTATYTRPGPGCARRHHVRARKGPAFPVAEPFRHWAVVVW